MNTPLPTVELSTGADPVASIIVMHGLGADGSDFAPFVDEIDLRPVGPVRWLFPNAPRRPVTINGGYVMPAWFDIRHDRADDRPDPPDGLRLHVAGDDGRAEGAGRVEGATGECATDDDAGDAADQHFAPDHETTGDGAMHRRADAPA